MAVNNPIQRFCSNCKCFRPSRDFDGRRRDYATCVSCRNRQSSIGRSVSEFATTFDEALEWIPSGTEGIKHYITLGFQFTKQIF